MDHQGTPPAYAGLCQREGCTHGASHTIIMRFWPERTHRLFRNKANSVNLFPAVAACDDHKMSLQEIGMHLLNQGMGSVRTHFASIDKGTPDLTDVLMDCVTIPEALETWKEPALH